MCYQQIRNIFNEEHLALLLAWQYSLNDNNLGNDLVTFYNTSDILEHCLKWQMDRPGLPGKDKKIILNTTISHNVSQLVWSQIFHN